MLQKEHDEALEAASKLLISRYRRAPGHTTPKQEEDDRLKALDIAVSEGEILGNLCRVLEPPQSS